MSVERILVHVGCPKTGTTFLQSTLWRSGTRLHRQGVELPLNGPDHYRLATAVLGLGDVSAGTDAPDDVLKRMVRAVRESKSATVLLDNETLVEATGNQASQFIRMLRKAAPGAELNVVITARDFARQAPSEWQQQIRSGRTFTWDRFARSLVRDPRLAEYFFSGQDPSDVARRWRADLPAEHIRIVTLPKRSCSPGILLDRFCSVLGVDPGVLDPARAEPNVSLSFPAAELLRRINIALDGRLPHTDGWYERFAKEFFTDQVLARVTQEGRPVVGGDLRDWCSAHADRVIRAIGEAGYDVVGDLDDLRPAAGPVEDSPGPSDDQLVGVAVSALADLLAGLRESRAPSGVPA